MSLGIAERHAAVDHATHKKDCTCKGKSFERNKHDSFLAGIEWRDANPSTEVKALVEALEHYESAHYTLEGLACGHDKTARNALAAYRAATKQEGGT